MKYLNPRRFVGGFLLWVVLCVVVTIYVQGSTPVNTDSVDLMATLIRSLSTLSGLYWATWFLFIRQKARPAANS